MSKIKTYTQLAASLQALTDGENDLIANLSNASAAIYQALDDVNWAGFYALEEDTLVLRSFQGKPACIRIPVGKGVCGTAVKKNRAQLVPDVHEFPGHIACDSASNSEMVIPIHAGGKIVGVLDVDSPKVGRFTQTDLKGLKLSVEALELVWERSLDKN